MARDATIVDDKYFEIIAIMYLNIHISYRQYGSDYNVSEFDVSTVPPYIWGMT